MHVRKVSELNNLTIIAKEIRCLSVPMQTLLNLMRKYEISVNFVKISFTLLLRF